MGNCNYLPMLIVAQLVWEKLKNETYFLVLWGIRVIVFVVSEKARENKKVFDLEVEFLL